MQYLVQLCLVLTSVISASQGRTGHLNKPHPKQKLIVILADGVRHDYVTDPTLKGFHRMSKNGVKAEYVQPIFPSNSYPNWYTIVTGMFNFDLV